MATLGLNVNVSGRLPSIPGVPTVSSSKGAMMALSSNALDPRTAMLTASNAYSGGAGAAAARALFGGSSSAPLAIDNQAYDPSAIAPIGPKGGALAPPAAAMGPAGYGYTYAQAEADAKRLPWTLIAAGVGAVALIGVVVMLKKKKKR